MSQKKAVIFDLDGTLSDTLSSITISANKTLEQFGFAPFEKECYRYFAGDGAEELLKRCLMRRGDEKLEYLDRVRAEYRQIFEEYCMYQVAPYEGIRELLSQLKERRIKTAVLSNKPHPRTVDVIDALFGKDSFDAVQGQTPAIHRKPSPEGVFLLEKKLGVSGKDIVYAGDTDTDMRTGKAAGAFTVGVLWGFRDRAELEANHADVLIEKPKQLLAYL